MRECTLEKSFTCRYCEKCFTSGGSCKKHGRNAHCDKSFKCGNCTKCFTSGRLRNMRDYTLGRNLSSVSTLKSVLQLLLVASYIREYTLGEPFQCNV